MRARPTASVAEPGPERLDALAALLVGRDREVLVGFQGGVDDEAQEALLRGRDGLQRGLEAGGALAELALVRREPGQRGLDGLGLGVPGRGVRVEVRQVPDGRQGRGRLGGGEAGRGGGRSGQHKRLAAAELSHVRVDSPRCGDARGLRGRGQLTEA
jgi:hypothetical protein